MVAPRSRDAEWDNDGGGRCDPPPDLRGLLGRERELDARRDGSTDGTVCAPA